MKKRVVLARILLAVTDPELILLDEPHPTLDTEGRNILDGLIQEWRKEGKTVILASHDHDLALSHVDRLIVLDEGKVSYDGPANLHSF
jgi:energy-coupling factor transporter ATP-binding protein EcfA2